MDALMSEVEALSSAISSLSASSPRLASETAALQQSISRVSAQLATVMSSEPSHAASGASSVAEAAAAPKPRGLIAKMSAEVVDTNPYSRLMALQRMGIVTNYERIRDKTVAIVGIGGVGSVAAEMLTRCGVGRLLLYDYDRVELANMNRLFFRPEQCGMSKTDATIQTLHGINPDVKLEGYNENITTVSGFTAFMASLRHKDTEASRVDLVLSCVDNYEARMVINQACNELGQTWMESGVSEDAVSGHVQLLVPGETACFECAPPLVVASGIDERTLKREGVCAASLPTTMGIVAGLLVQNALKHLLQFGTVTRYLGYSALKDFFPSYEMKPNPSCSNAACCGWQAKHLQHLSSAEFLAAQAAAAQSAAEEAAAAAAVPLHAENEWNIAVVDDAAGSDASQEAPSQQLPDGLHFSMPKADKVDASKLQSEAVASTDESVDDLMAQLRALDSSSA